ncbi:MAG: phosphomannomutase/phosphoglucomutase, partial [Rhodanobacter sp.]
MKQAKLSAVDWQRLLPLAGGTLLLLLGLFCAWQAWLIANESTAIAQVHVAQAQAVKVLTADIAEQRGKVEKALAAIDPHVLADDPASAVVALRQALPEAHQLDLYSGSLNEVLHANYREFGYAKAAQLMSAQTNDGLPPVQSVSYGGGDRRLSLVVPVGPPAQAKAWLWVELP